MQFFFVFVRELFRLTAKVFKQFADERAGAGSWVKYLNAFIYQVMVSSGGEGRGCNADGVEYQEGERAGLRADRTYMPLYVREDERLFPFSVSEVSSVSVIFSHLDRKNEILS